MAYKVLIPTAGTGSRLGGGDEVYKQVVNQCRQPTDTCQNY